MKVFISIDKPDLEHLFRITQEMYKIGISTIEVGTPVIKRFGMKPVSLLRARFPDAYIFADTKTVDVGELEARIAFESGADMMSVLAIAPSKTIKAALGKSKRYNGSVLIDTIGANNLMATVEKIVSLGAEKICIHTAIDEGLVENRISLLREIKDRFTVEIGAAGGIDPETARKLANVNLDFIMVGRYVTESSHPDKAAKEILEAIG